MNLLVLLQAAQTVADVVVDTVNNVAAAAVTAAAPIVAPVAAAAPEIIPPANYFDLLQKGGWIVYVIFALSLVAIYLIIERWVVISKLGKTDSVWTSRVLELINENKIEKAIKLSLENHTSTAQITAAGLKDYELSTEVIENSMQTESRNQIAALEKGVNYLGIISSAAPMLGFLGTIFGVIQIFYNISQMGNLDIAAISEGLYQKMICSGAGLLVGIVAYAGFHIINTRIDRTVLDLDKNSNEILKAIKIAKK